MIGNLRLSRSELTRRRERKKKIRALILLTLAGLTICVRIGVHFSTPILPPVGLAEEPEAAQGPGAADYLAIPDQDERQEDRDQPLSSDKQATDGNPSPWADDPPAPDSAADPVNWLSYYVETNRIVPIHREAGERSDIAGSLNPGAMVYGYDCDDGWICIADTDDSRYYVKSEYVTPFTQNMSEISIFQGDYKTISGKFSINTNMNSMSGLTLEDVLSILQQYPALRGIEETVLLCEKTYGVNAYFILGVACHESGFGTSFIAARKNNLFGIGAYSDNTFDSALSFASKSDSVDYFGILMARYRENGKTTPAQINELYASDETWASRIVYIMNDFSILASLS